MRKAFRILTICLAVTPFVTACSRTMDRDVVTSRAAVGKVLYGAVISARAVTVKDAERLQDNALGGLAGGVTGGVAGSAVGSGTGKSLATAGGAIAGAVLGAMIQDELGTSEGTEYIVQLDTAQATAHDRQRKEYRMGGNNSVASDVNQSLQLQDMQTQTLAVVQKDEAGPIPIGTRVMVVYYDDRPRVVPVTAPAR